MAMTRRELRLEVAGNVKDVVEVTASSGGSTNTFQDAVSLTRFDNSLTSSQILITSGHPDNVGQVRRVVGSRFQTASVTFYPDLPQPVQAGDTAEIYNLAGNGFDVSEYNRVLKGIVQGQAHRYLIERRWDVPYEDLVIEEHRVLVPVPDEAVGISSAWLADRERVIELRRARHPNQPGYHVNSADRRVEINGREAHYVEKGNQIALYGYIEHPPLLEDDDICLMDQEWVILTASAKLSQKRGDRFWDQWSVEWARAASAREGNLAIAFKPNTVLFRRF